MEETSMIVSPCVPSIDTSPIINLFFVHLLLRLFPNNQIQEALFFVL